MVTQPHSQKFHMDYINGSESFIMLVAIHTFRCSPLDPHFENDFSKILYCISLCCSLCFTLLLLSCTQNQHVMLQTIMYLN